MSKQRPAPRSSATKLSPQDVQAEETRRRLRRAVARAKEIKSLAKQLQRLNDEAQRALLDMAREVYRGERLAAAAEAADRGVGQ